MTEDQESFWLDMPEAFQVQQDIVESFSSPFQYGTRSRIQNMLRKRDAFLISSSEWYDWHLFCIVQAFDSTHKKSYRRELNACCDTWQSLPDSDCPDHLDRALYCGLERDSCQESKMAASCEIPQRPNHVDWTSFGLADALLYMATLSLQRSGDFTNCRHFWEFLRSDRHQWDHVSWRASH